MIKIKKKFLVDVFIIHSSPYEQLIWTKTEVKISSRFYPVFILR